MGRLTTLLGALGLGAGLMYWYDPDLGRRRRSLLRDQVNSSTNQLTDLYEKAREDMRNRFYGVQAELSGALDPEPVPDGVLAERARAQMGRFITHPGAIQIEAQNGRLLVNGHILRDEVDKLMTALSRVRGAKGVENRLQVHDSPAGVPALQGLGRPRIARPELMQENWAPSTRLLTGVGGTALTLVGMRRGGLIGALYSLGGLALALRGITNQPVRRLVGPGAGRRAIDVMKTINVNAPVEEVYALWSNFPSFPRFMSHVKEVKDLGNGRSQWVVAGPGGVPVEFVALTSKMLPNEVIAWKSEQGQPVQSAGIVNFEPNPGGGTRVTVRMSYNPPAGALGHAVASLFGADPKRAMDEDLLRFKSLIETGKTSAEGQHVRREDVTAGQTGGGAGTGLATPEQAGGQLPGQSGGFLGGGAGGMSGTLGDQPRTTEGTGPGERRPSSP